MNRTYTCLEYQKALLHYSEYGRGSKVLICFHGYGQSSEHFRNLEEVLKDEYKIFSFDLFYHGKSFWHEKEKPLSKEFWEQIIKKFLEEKKIDRFSLLGFSMGGKFTFGTFEKFFAQIDKVILIAPDGIKTNFWYNLATYPYWMRKIFRSTILKPQIFIKLVKIFGALRIVDKGLLRFANTQMATLKQRRRVYYSWVVFRDLKFDMKEIAALFNENNIKLEMFLGEFDKVIPQKNMKNLLDKLSNYSINVLKSGHTHLIEAVAEFYKGKK